MEDHMYYLAQVKEREGEYSCSKTRKREAKRNRDRRRQKTRINIGVAFPKWKSLMRDQCFQSDAEVAGFLLDSFTKGGPDKSLTESRTEWTSSDESVDETTESANSESEVWKTSENQLPRVEAITPNIFQLNEHNAPMEIELELTRSMTNNPLSGPQREIKRERKDVQMRPFTPDEEGNCNLSESSYAILSKEILVLLMFRCLECSSECRVRGKGKGGSLSLRQECLICCNYRVWTSRPADMSKEKVTDMSLILSCDDICPQTSDNLPLTVDQEATNVKCDDSLLKASPPVQMHEDKASNSTVQDNTDADNDISSFVVKEEKEEEESLLMETHEDTVSISSVQGDSNGENDCGFNISAGKDKPSKPTSPETPALLSDHKEVFIDENNGLKLVEKMNDQTSMKKQGDGSEESPLSSSYEPTDSSDEEFSEAESAKKPQKPFQNTIKPIIWCIDCDAVAKMFCTVRRHQKIYGCVECVVSNDVRCHKFKDFSVHFSDIITFHKHAIDMHGATGNPPEIRVCEDCNKTIRVETDPKKKGHVCEYKIKPFSCHLCRKRFFTEIGQKVHYRRLHGDYTHTCKYCMMAFNTKPSKLQHEQTHNEDGLPYLCPDCPEKFKDFIGRNQHLKSHRGQKKYICHMCDRKFLSLQRYERHMRIHSGEKPYTCQVCERSFNQASHLKSHMRLHTGEKPFMCEQCGECFNHNVSLKNHLLRQHGIDSTRTAREESKQIGRPMKRFASSTLNKDLQKKKRVRKSSSAPSMKEEEEEEEEGVEEGEEALCNLNSDYVEESQESDSEGDDWQRGRIRKAMRKKRAKRQNHVEGDDR
ncbi:zinc finger protein 572-like [Electrophorus electricus]|uniref:zinc finger protein 572-like n=1 Tax=Electrophorus electricus TaxID=8005 RepID=UPI0015D07798|nr:zinc finger protein 572-like [Electrophorus electricus]